MVYGKKQIDSALEVSMASLHWAKGLLTSSLSSECAPSLKTRKSLLFLLIYYDTTCVFHYTYYITCTGAHQAPVPHTADRRWHILMYDKRFQVAALPTNIQTSSLLLPLLCLSSFLSQHSHPFVHIQLPNFLLANWMKPSMHYWVLGHQQRGSVG